MIELELIKLHNEEEDTIKSFYRVRTGNSPDSVLSAVRNLASTLYFLLIKSIML